MSNYGIKVSKGGIEVKTAANKDLLISSDFDTFKIQRTGSLTISIPTETLKNTSKTYTATYSHNLGYIPFVLPSLNLGIGNPAPFNLDFTKTPVEYQVTTPYVFNDIEEQYIPPGPFGFGGPVIVFEVANLEVSSTQLKIVVTRTSSVLDPFTGLYEDVKFTASTGTLYYTIFHNRADEEFNLL
jgi:hypothetical protein